MGIIQTSTSTSRTASIAERLRTFVYPISYSSLSLISLSIIYILILPLYNFFIAYILQISRGFTAQSLQIRAQIFYFKASLQLVALPIQIIIIYTSIGLQVAYLLAQGIIGIIAAIYIYKSVPIDTSPFFIAIIITL